MPTTLPYGSWPSPLTAAAVAAAPPRIDGAALVGDEVWWGQSVPEEAGRTSVRRRRVDGGVEDVLPAPASARSRVHEYGGGAWAATDDGELVYVEKTDQRVRALRPGGAARDLTPPDADVAYGGLRVQAGRLLAVRERSGDTRVPERHIVEIALDGSGRVHELVGGSDFVAQPALSADGRRLAWIAWNHPDMPWDRTELRVGDVGPDGVTSFLRVAGGDATAPLQPTWTADGGLLYLDDPTGRWNVWRMSAPDGSLPSVVRAVAPADADTGGALWVLGTRWYAALDDGGIVAVRTNGSDEIVRIAADGTARPLAVPISASAAVEASRGDRVLVSGAGPRHPGGLWLVDLASGDIELVAGGEAPWDVAWSPVPREIAATGPRGEVHAFAYPPTNPHADAPAGQAPPYLVLVHGGPTSHVGPAASAKIAYFTSRGIGVLDVNYGGSTGYGRAYRERLRGQWGVVDVEDVAAAAASLADAGVADPARLAIEGGSAGGWTVLAALVGTDVFAAGISRYGVGDARALAADTHDFEARYLDGLIGPLPETEAVYIDRSPLTRPDRFRVPLLILQGNDDRVVPPAQAEAIRDALATHGVPHAYVLYEGEGHGFRRADTVIDALEKELAFLGGVFGFDTPGVPPLPLE
jgi:dipeptidyl aminopeptidase/acylaminoacyl peptidase